MGAALSLPCCGGRDRAEFQITTSPTKGDDMFRRRQQQAAQMDLKDKDAPPPAEAPPLLTVPIEKKRKDQWRISGIYEEIALKVGLRQLDLEWSTKDLFVFPQRAAGSSKLQREKLMEDLLREARPLKSVPVSDVSAAQGDINLLSLRQLLKLRVANLSFVPRGSTHETHSNFIAKVDGRLFEELGKAGSRGTVLDASATRQLGLDLVLIAAAGTVLPDPQCWVVWLGTKRAIFNRKLFQCVSSFPTKDGVLEIADATAVDRNTSFQRSLDWLVTLARVESALSSVRIVPSAADQAAAGYGAQTNGPSLSFEAINNQLATLKKTGVDKS